MGNVTKCSIFIASKNGPRLPELMTVVGGNMIFTLFLFRIRITFELILSIYLDVLDVNLFVKRLHGNIGVFAGKLLILHMNVEKHLILAEKYVENHWKIVHRLHHLLKTINEMYVLTNVLIFVILVHVLLVWLVFYSKYLPFIWKIH